MFNQKTFQILISQETFTEKKMKEWVMKGRLKMSSGPHDPKFSAFSMETEILGELQQKTNIIVLYTPDKISNWSLFKLIFSDQALIILKRIFAYIHMCVIIGKCLWCFGKFIFQS